MGTIIAHCEALSPNFQVFNNFKIWRNISLPCRCLNSKTQCFKTLQNNVLSSVPISIHHASTFVTMKRLRVYQFVQSFSPMYRIIYRKALACNSERHLEAVHNINPLSASLLPSNAPFQASTLVGCLAMRTGAVTTSAW